MITAGLVISVLVKLYDSAVNKQWDNVEKILAVIVIGGIVGYFGLSGLDMPGGMIAGLEISGLMTTGGFIASKLKKG